MASFLRPDEQAAQANVSRAERNRDFIKSGFNAASGAAIASKVVPWLSQYISPDLAMKGISKVAPKLGEFLENGRKMGLDVGQGLDFIRERVPQEEQSKKAVDSKNIISQYSPSLFEKIKEMVMNGMKPIEAAFRIRRDMSKSEFKKAIQKIENDHNTPFESIVDAIFGGDSSQNDPMQMQQPSQMQQMQPQGNSQSSGGIDPGLAQLIQQGSALLQKFKGA